MNKQTIDQLKNYMHGAELKIKSGFMTWLTNGFHILVLIVGMILAFLVGTKYHEISKAMNPVSENSSKVHSATSTSISLTDRNELILIDRISGKYTIYSDTLTISIWKSLGEKFAATALK